MEALETSVKFLLLALLWVILASPFFLISFFVGRAMRRRGVTSPFALVPFTAAVAVLLAPIPTPIVTVFYPSGYALLAGTLHSHFMGTEAYFSGLRPWVTSSLIITFAVCGLTVLRSIATPAEGKRSSGSSGA